MQERSKYLNIKHAIAVLSKPLLDLACDSLSPSVVKLVLNWCNKSEDSQVFLKYIQDCDHLHLSSCDIPIDAIVLCAYRIHFEDASYLIIIVKVLK